MLKQAVRNSPNIVHLLKVKTHAGIAGNECADAVAKYQTTQADTSHAETGMPCANGLHLIGLYSVSMGTNLCKSIILELPLNLPMASCPLIVPLLSRPFTPFAAQTST